MEIDAEPGRGDLLHPAMRLWRRKWWIVGPVALLVAVSVARSARATDVYTSRTTVRPADPNSFVVFQTQPGSTPNPVRQTATQVELVHSAAVEDLVRAELGDRFDGIEELRVSQLGDTDILEITITSASPELARAAANSYAESYLEVSQATQVKALEHQANELSAVNRENQARIVELNDTIDQLNAEIVALGRDVALGIGDETRYDAARSELQLAEGQRSSLVLNSQTLEQRVVQLQVEANARRDVAGQVLRPANLPTSPTSPTPVRDALVYAMVGGLLGLTLAWARDAFRGKLRDLESVNHAAPQVPVLGAPMQLAVRRGAHASSTLITLGDNKNASAQEAYRALRTSVQTATPGGTLLITSPGVREGKTTTVANLAGSLAAAGAKVAVVCGDLHRPNVHEVFSESNSVGLTSVLLGKRTLEEALRPIEVGGGVLRLLASGPLPPNPAELLGSTAMGEVVASLGRTFDYVLVDSPPVLSVTDPIVASRWCDHVVVVLRAGRTTTRDLRVTLERLHRAGVEPLGLVFNGATASMSPAYYYAGYGGDPASEGHIPREEWDRVVRTDGAVHVGRDVSLAAPISAVDEVPAQRGQP